MMEVDITQGSIPLSCARAVVELTSTGPHSTEVQFTINYEPMFGPLGWMMDKLMMKKNFNSVLGKVLEGLDPHVRTGALIGRDAVVLEPAQAVA
jgi:hypothetical protein